MAEIVCKCGVKRQKGYLYFVNKKGDLAREQLEIDLEKVKNGEQHSSIYDFYEAFRELIKDPKTKQVIGFEKLNFLPSKSAVKDLPVEVVVG